MKEDEIIPKNKRLTHKKIKTILKSIECDEHLWEEIERAEREIIEHFI